MMGVDLLSQDLKEHYKTDADTFCYENMELSDQNSRHAETVRYSHVSLIFNFILDALTTLLLILIRPISLAGHFFYYVDPFFFLIQSIFKHVSLGISYPGLLKLAVEICDDLLNYNQFKSNKEFTKRKGERSRDMRKGVSERRVSRKGLEKTVRWDRN